MTQSISPPSDLSDQDLLVHVQQAARDERQAMAQLIALLMELVARKLYLAQGCASLFTFCMQVLHLSEHAAYGRIEAARAARRFPIILDGLAEGTLNLTTITLLEPHLTPENHVAVLDAARGKSKREVEHLVARLRPQPDVLTRVRKLPEPKTPSEVCQPAIAETDPCESPLSVAPTIQVAPTRPAEVKPLAPERYKVQFTVSRDTYEKLRRAQDLLRHQIPNGDPAAIFDRALTVLIEDVSRTKLAASKQPRGAQTPRRTTSRHIPAAVKREVWERDGGQCTFVGARGRCTETGFLEFHHRIPFADGGTATTDNLEIRCRAHNAYEAEQYFGLRPPPLVREPRENYGLEHKPGPDRAAGALVLDHTPDGWDDAFTAGRGCCAAVPEGDFRIVDRVATMVHRDRLTRVAVMSNVSSDRKERGYIGLRAVVGDESRSP